MPLVSCAHRSFLLTAPVAFFLLKKKLPYASVSDYLLANASRISRTVAKLYIARCNNRVHAKAVAFF